MGAARAEGRVAIVAGNGLLPGLLAEALRARDPLLVRVQGMGVSDPPPEGEVLDARLETLGALFAGLRDAGVSEVVFAGAARRPALDPALFDDTFRAVAPRIVPALAAGDDALLRLVATIFEEAGFVVRAPGELRPDLLPAEGVFGNGTPAPEAQRDVARAEAILEALAPVDLGQGAVVSGGLCLGVETIQGTDVMLAHVAATRDPVAPSRPGGRGVLLKAPKRGQDRRMDLPVIGPATIAGAARAGLVGVAIEAGGVMVLDRSGVERAAEAAGLWVWVRPQAAAEAP